TIEVTFGPGGSPTNNETLFRELRACTAVAGSCALLASINTRHVVFISPPDVKVAATPRSGIGTTTLTGQYFDPWGTNYVVRIDGDYNNQVANPYGAQTVGGAGSDPIASGVVAWSRGSDQALGTNGNNVYRNPSTGAQSDDV